MIMKISGLSLHQGNTKNRKNSQKEQKSAFQINFLNPQRTLLI